MQLIRIFWTQCSYNKGMRGNRITCAGDSIHVEPGPLRTCRAKVVGSAFPLHFTDGEGSMHVIKKATVGPMCSYELERASVKV